jgi:hypothetical protein
MECPNPNPMPNQTTRTAQILNVPTSMSQHQCHNIDSTLKCPKPTKTPKIPNRQKSQKPPAKNSRQKFPRRKKIPARKIKSQQKFPQQHNKNPTNYNLFSQSRIQSLLNNL